MPLLESLSCNLRDRLQKMLIKDPTRGREEARVVAGFQWFRGGRPSVGVDQFV